MILAQGRLGRAWMSLTSSLSGCHFDEESAKGASGLNWSGIGLFYTYESCEYLIIFALYIIQMHCILHLVSSVIWSAALLLLQTALVADWSCEGTSTEIHVCIKYQWCCERLSRVQVWKQTAWFLIGLTIITYCRLCHGDWYYSGGSITCLVVPLPLKSEGAGGREIVIAESTSFNVLKPWWSCQQTYSQQLDAICVHIYIYISNCIGSTYPHAARVAWLECTRLTSSV